MKIRAYITAYDRPEMLKQVVERFQEFDIEPIIYEDGVTHPHRGKKGFWKTWDEILKDCKENEADLYIFTQDDCMNLDFERLREYHKRFKYEPYTFHLINDGSHQRWGGFKKQEPVDGVERVGFTDCIFFCNREALEAIGFHILPIKETRWRDFPNLSSGVGQQLTGRLHRAKVKMYKPVKSLAYHGDHESKMNPEERKKNPLISK